MEKTFNGKRLVQATMDDLEFSDGYNTVSLVENPATKKDMFLFKDHSGKKNKSFHFEVVSEDRRLIMGVMMVADTPIARIHPDTNEEFYMEFPRDLVERMSFKAMKDKRTDNVNIEHRSDLKVHGVYLVESWIFDPSRGYKLPKFLKGVPEGSWIVTLKVEDEDLWTWIKDGIVKGLSLEGNFGLSEKFNSDDFDITEIKTKLNRDGSVNDHYNILKTLVNGKE